MLAHTRAFSGFSVDDIPAARDFYRDVLGVDVEEMDNGLLTLRLAGSHEAIVAISRCRSRISMQRSGQERASSSPMANVALAA